MSDGTRQLGRYELIERIAVGGMGEIYLAKSRGAAGFEKTVIIKKILEHLAEEEEFVTKFLDEGRIVVNLTHGNIVPVFDMGEEDGEYFIAMEYVHGRDLRDILKRAEAQDHEVPLDLAIHIVAQVCNGLDYAHRQTDDDGNPLDIVHRDISPSNIMVSREGEVKIIDFGIARAASRAAKTASGRIQGKICYMSPEQASGRSLDARSDIFSTGVVLYELLTGVRPFQGESDMHSLDLVRKCQFEAPSELNPNIPEPLDAIVERAMAEDPEERYPRIHGLHVDLLEFAHSQGRAVMGQEVSKFVTDLFPEGFEREDLKKAREKGPDSPMNLDDALNAELDKLGGDVNPLQTTAAHDSTPDSRRKTPAVDAHTATLAADADEVSAGTNPSDDPTGNTGPTTENAELSTNSGTEDNVPTGRVEEDENHGFKRWLAIAVVLGVVAGAGAIWYFLTVKSVGNVLISAQPQAQGLRVDGNKTFNVETPYELELEEGEHTVELLAPDGYRDKKIVVNIEGGEVGRRRLERNVELQQLPRKGEETRTFFVSTTPANAEMTVDKEPRGNAPIKVTLAESSNPKVIVTASHEGCEDNSEIILFDRENDVVPIKLECPVASADAGSDADEEAAAAKTTDKPTDRGPRYRRLTIATSPVDAKLTVNGEQFGAGEAVERKWRTSEVLDVRAELYGYKTAERKIRVGDVRDRQYLITLEKRPMGCVRVNLLKPHVMTLHINGREIAAERADRIDLPVGKHNIVATNESADFRRTFTVKIPAGDKCTLLDATAPTN
ncbi:MAG: serine/threonine protein kinase [Myxococcota bacterium]